MKVYILFYHGAKFYHKRIILYSFYFNPYLLTTYIEKESFTLIIKLKNVEKKVLLHLFLIKYDEAAF